MPGAVRSIQPLAMRKSTSDIVEARVEFDPSWNHSCQKQALCSAPEPAKL